MRVEVDFKGDYFELCRRALARSGVYVSANTTGEKLSVAYWNFQFRRIEPRPRRVHLSKNFVEPIDSSLKAAIDHIRQLLSTGGDVAPFQSKSIRNTKHSAFHDRLYNDWGIQHFHLGTHSPGDFFSTRTGPLLFATVRHDDAYLIGVLPHGSWAERSLLETIHSNWPEILRALSGVTSASIVSDEEYAALRKAGVSVPFTTSDGTVYMAVNGGYMSTGLSAPVLIRSDDWLDRLDDLERWIESHAEGELVKRGVSPPEVLRPRLVIEDGRFYAFDEEAKILLELGSTPT